MSPTERIPVVPELLTWARESAGLPPEVAAKRLGVSVDSLAQWESGDRLPTIKQLRNVAKLYKRPLAVLLLPAPPTDFSPIKDFRAGASGQGTEWSPVLRAELKRAVMQREVFLELDELAPGSLSQPESTISLTADAEVENAGRAIREVLGIDQDVYALASNAYENLTAWVIAVETLGALVIHTRGVKVAEARGFSVSEWPHPVIALNGADSPRARLFTLLHELCHLALNAGGLCDLHETRSTRGEEDEIEHYCNQVAASTLMPRDLLLRHSTITSAQSTYEWSLDELSALSTRFGTSSESLLLRLISMGKATWDLYWIRKPEFEREYEEARERQREQQRQTEGGPSYYTVKARDLGHGYVASVLDAFRSKAISALDVADYLDVRYDQLPKLEKAVRR